MKASSLSFQAAILMGLAGMCWGVYMAISDDRSTLPAHAHLNLLGFVTLFLFGVYYRLHPALDGAPIARLQITIWIVATIVLIIGVAMVHSGKRAGDPIAAVSSLIVIADMLLFGWLMMRNESGTSAAGSVR